MSAAPCGFRLGDEAEALRYYQDSHRMFPANMDVVSWLGAFHVKNEVRMQRNAVSKHHLLCAGFWPLPDSDTGCAIALPCSAVCNREMILCVLTHLCLCGQHQRGGHLFLSTGQALNAGP